MISLNQLRKICAALAALSTTFAFHSSFAQAADATLTFAGQVTANNAPLSSSECTTNPNAYLNFSTIGCSPPCIYTPKSPTFTNNGTSVDIFFVDTENFATRSSFYSPASAPSSSIFKIEKKITIACSGGGLLASLDPAGGVSVSGINGPSCNGAYTVTHTVTVYQTSSTPTAGTTPRSFPLGSDLNLQITLFDGVNPTRVSYRSGVFSGSGQIYLAFVANKCTVTVPSPVALPNENNLNIFYNRGLRTTMFAVQINAGCAYTYNQMDLFWDFGRVDSGDPTILLNSSGVDYATNVGVRISVVDSFLGTSTPVTNRTAVQLTSNTFNSRNITHSVIFTKSSAVSDPNLITPGTFNARATLNIRYR